MIKTVTNVRIENIPIEQLYISDLNIRRDHEFGDEEDQELSKNIESIGLLQPIVVRPVGDMFEILVGRRRFLTMKQSKNSEITCLVKDLNDEEALDASISENLFRKGVDPVTLGKWIKRRLENNDISLSEYSRKIGKPKSTLSEWTRMNDLQQELQEEVQKGSVPFNYALKVARLNLNPEEERRLAEEARQTGFEGFKKAVDRIIAGHEKRGAPKGLLVIRINFGKESDLYDKLREISETKGLDVGEYCRSVLEEHVRSPNN